jgi:hypothetical protein
MSEETEHLQLEELLSDALRPIEPPESLAGRVETTLTAITEQAAAELSSWAEELSESELDALRDPRNWVRPVAAAPWARSRAERSCSSARAAPSADRPTRRRGERDQVRSIELAPGGRSEGRRLTQARTRASLTGLRRRRQTSEPQDQMEDVVRVHRDVSESVAVPMMKPQIATTT